MRTAALLLCLVLTMIVPAAAAVAQTASPSAYPPTCDPATQDCDTEPVEDETSIPWLWIIIGVVLLLALVALVLSSMRGRGAAP